MIESINVGGVERKLGCLPRTTKIGDGTFPVFSDDFLIDRSDWPNYQNTLRPLAWHIINQGSQGSCCGCASVQAVMICRELAGLDRVALSQAVPYGLGNGGRDSGMGIDTGLRMIQKHGTCPVDVVDPMDWRQRNWPDNWKEIAAKYRGIEAHDCPSFEHMVSAVLRGWPVVYGAKGHAIVLVNQNLDVANSWGDWKDNGFGVWATEREIKRGRSTYGAWALCTAVDPVNDGDVVTA